MSEEIGPQVPPNLLSKFQGDSDTSESTLNQKLDASEPNHDPEKRNSQYNAQIGPQIPLSTEMDEAEEDLDAYLPALPPDLLAERQRKKAAKLEQNVDSQRKGAANPRRRPIGPTLPHPTEYSNFDEEDVVIGPILPKDFEENKDDLILQQTIQEFEERAEKMRQTLEPDDKTDKPLQRGEWMLVPPESKFLGETPTNMRSRSFKQKTHDPEKIDNSLWTETPADRQIRLQKQSTSQKRKHEKEKDDEPIKYSRTDIEKAEAVKAYNELHRSKSLLETHSEGYTKSRKWKDDDVSQRPFDREKDVLGSRRMDSRKRKEFLENARGLNSKFGHGKGGVFL
ncbi:9282_t:CDS:2 [Dentiscutata heterogama]|uniref:9282_t:CDS:1 n=1 Tax=Dentiscutata heterogama TaxID=1316150 RepID=A0ACA9NXN0_9GLOM|nr:9282_t:CDS:2 [Dentiscutata heterogama]